MRHQRAKDTSIPDLQCSLPPVPSDYAHKPRPVEARHFLQHIRGDDVTIFAIDFNLKSPAISAALGSLKKSSPFAPFISELATHFLPEGKYWAKDTDSHFHFTGLALRRDNEVVPRLERDPQILNCYDQLVRSVGNEALSFVRSDTGFNRESDIRLSGVSMILIFQTANMSTLRSEVLAQMNASGYRLHKEDQGSVFEHSSKTHYHKYLYLK